MGEIPKRTQIDDRPEYTDESSDPADRRLKFSLRHVDFVSPLGAFRAQRNQPGLELAPNNSEAWQDWRVDLGRRIARTARQADELLAEASTRS
ncbi:MAG TPA: hypothetical protein VIQ80_00085 [Candidatus Saccharimonadales bacterium]